MFSSGTPFLLGQFQKSRTLLTAQRTRSRQINKFIILKWMLLEYLVFPAGISLSQFLPYRADFQKKKNENSSKLFIS